MPKNPASRRMERKSPAERTKPPVGPLRATRKKGERQFIVSLAGPRGGGRQVLFAKSPREAAERAMKNRFGKNVPGKTEAIITDLSKKRNSQTFLITK